MRDFYSEESYRHEQSLLAKLSWQKGEHDFLRKSVTRKCVRKECTKIFETKLSDPKRYCSQSCAVKVNNIGARRYPPREKRFCRNCNVFLIQRQNVKYCSVRCQVNYQYSKYIQLWKNGAVDGIKGITTKSLCAHIRKYIIKKFENKCSRCGWNELHPVTNKVPLEIEHMDGNSENNKEENLILLCPNCHSLTPFYKNLNRGNGRKWRMDKYIKNVV